MTASVVPLFRLTTDRTEFLFREFNLIKQSAGIFWLTRAAPALLSRHTCVKRRHEELNIALKADN